MKGYIFVVNFLVLVWQCSAKHVPDDIFPGYSGDGSGEDTTIIVRPLSTTTIKILNDDDDIDDAIATTITLQKDDDLYINQTSQDSNDQGVTEKNNSPIDSDDVSVNEAIIGLVIVASLTFCCITVLLVVIVVRKRRSSQKRNIPTVYPNSRNFFITSTEKCSKSTEFLDVSGSTFEYAGQ